MTEISLSDYLVYLVVGFDTDLMTSILFIAKEALYAV